MTDKPFRLLPRLDDDNREFWTAGERGELVIERCGACGHYVHPPRPICPECLSRDVGFEPVSGRGSVLSYTVNHQPWNPTMPPPYVIALVELDEQPGLRLMSNVVGCEPDEVDFGMRVRVAFEQHDDVWVPLFEPEPAA